MKPLDKCPVCGGELVEKRSRRFCEAEIILQSCRLKPKFVCIVVNASIHQRL